MLENRVYKVLEKETPDKAGGMWKVSSPMWPIAPIIHVTIIVVCGQTLAGYRFHSWNMHIVMANTRFHILMLSVRRWEVFPEQVLK